MSDGMSDIEHWKPPTDREWTEAEHWRWTAEHHLEFRLLAEKDRATLRQQLEGAVGLLRELAQMSLRASGKDFDRLVKAARDYLPEYN